MEEINSKETLAEKYITDLQAKTRLDKNGNLKPRVRKIKPWREFKSYFSNSKKIDLEHFDNIWVWSDHHFHHNNIIQYSDRPFDNVDEMNQFMIDNHLDYVSENDLCFWVGDVGFQTIEKTNELLQNIKGYNILIQGNHDFDRKGNVRKLHFNEAHLLYELEYEGIDFILSHYPFNTVEWPQINLHGHGHINGGESWHDNQINVNVEFWDYKPLHMDEIVKIIEAKKENRNDSTR